MINHGCVSMSCSILFLGTCLVLPTLAQRPRNTAYLLGAEARYSKRR